MFVTSDAWLLLSLIYLREPADRDRIREAGDYINRAIFTDEELDGGLARLEAADLVVAVADRWVPTEHALERFKKATGGKHGTGVRKDLERLEKDLGIGLPPNPQSG